MLADRIRHISSAGDMIRFKIVMQRTALEVDEQTEHGEKICTNDRFLDISDKEYKWKFTAKSNV